MAEQVTIEGSRTPSVYLKRGHRQTVRLTEWVQTLIDKGYVVVIDRSGGEYDEPGDVTLDDPSALTDAEVEADTNADEARADLGVPGDDASRDDWALFLLHLTPAPFFPDDADLPTLKMIWQGYSGGH